MTFDGRVEEGPAPKPEKKPRRDVRAERLAEREAEMDQIDRDEAAAIVWVEEEQQREKERLLEEKRELCRLFRLAKARLLFGWLVHYPARTADGEIVSPDHPDAVAWSLVGSIGLGRLRPMSEVCSDFVVQVEERAFRFLESLLQQAADRRLKLKSSRVSLRTWSERDERRKVDVVDIVTEGEKRCCS